MNTTHNFLYTNAQDMSSIDSNSVHLVVTSPPYPMIELWDENFSNQSETIQKALENGDGALAFELMNKELDKIWKEVSRVLIPGGLACINIGDATRSINKKFQLYTSHARFLSYFTKLGFQTLPEIIWRKQTNAPNKFMGSGMLPAGAYVTLEHEYILIIRKGGKREFKTKKEKQNRQESSYFWEERNKWFSDLWEFKGTKQNLDNKNSRERSAAYPFELAYRLINMYSVKGDIVLDPFLGTGTTALAAVASCRNSIGFEIDSSLKQTILNKLQYSLNTLNEFIFKRLQSHIEFVKERISKEMPLKHVNLNYNFPVMTKQETFLLINLIKLINITDDGKVEVNYYKETKISNSEDFELTNLTIPKVNKQIKIKNLSNYF